MNPKKYSARERWTTKWDGIEMNTRKGKETERGDAKRYNGTPERGERDRIIDPKKWGREIWIPKRGGGGGGGGGEEELVPQKKGGEREPMACICNLTTVNDPFSSPRSST